LEQMLGARKGNGAQIAPGPPAGELNKGRVVKSRKLHSAVDSKRIDWVQRRGGPVESTVKKHVLEIFEKLGVETRGAAALRALEVLSSRAAYGKTPAQLA
jgi:hypothetical protein